MNTIVNYHVIDPKNVGDLLSSPTNYFEFPGYSLERSDIRDIGPESDFNKHIIVGGGGLLFPKFLTNIGHLVKMPNRGKLIAWGVGQQIYGVPEQAKISVFDYSSYLNEFDLVGIRDFNTTHGWVPCASCMHPAFDKKRDIKHEFVVFSHKKFQISIETFPRMTNATQEFEQVLDFLGSGETILTSSYHGAYWAGLLGRKVLAFPFTSKFYTLKHAPNIYPVKKWVQSAYRLNLFGKRLFEFRHKDKFTCSVVGWRDYLKTAQAYPDSLEENRAVNQAYYARVMNMLADATIS